MGGSEDETIHVSVFQNFQLSCKLSPVLIRTAENYLVLAFRLQSLYIGQRWAKNGLEISATIRPIV